MTQLKFKINSKKMTYETLILKIEKCSQLHKTIFEEYYVQSSYHYLIFSVHLIYLNIFYSFSLACKFHEAVTCQYR